MLHKYSKKLEKIFLISWDQYYPEPKNEANITQTKTIDQYPSWTYVNILNKILDNQYIKGIRYYV